jgi:MFS family permease
MIVASVVTGRWIAHRGPRSAIVCGCMVFATGLLLIGRVLSPSQPYLGLAVALTVAGIGIGIIVVPTTFAAVNAVPLDRAGMASSAVNTSREIGAVAGTAVLGAIVNASLISHLNSQLDKLHLSSLKGLIIPEVLHGGAALTGSGGGSAASKATTPLAKQLLESVYSAFYSGLHVCLVLSAGIVVAAGVVTLAALRREPVRESALDEEYEQATVS